MGFNDQQDNSYSIVVTQFSVLYQEICDVVLQKLFTRSKLRNFSKVEFLLPKVKQISYMCIKFIF